MSDPSSDALRALMDSKWLKISLSYTLVSSYLPSRSPIPTRGQLSQVFTFNGTCPLTISDLSAW